MGHESIVYGYIKGSTLRPGENFFDLHPINSAIINRLPKDDEWPFLTRSMFSVVGNRPQTGRYRRQIIHFGASFKMIETDWEEWLEKFENLLRQLYWSEAKLHLETEFLGKHFYLWKARFLNPLVTPTTEWDCEGGPRKFDI